MPLTLEDVYELLGTKDIPGDDHELKVLTNWTEDLIKRNGTNWIKEHRDLLLNQWEWCLEMGV
ncbi:MAG: hypothetical protein JRH18_19975 [Deltaproteobacteria bacterium]|nr:hypothetical protein [Deltaproteobacteria bacterium]MBW2153930.1 hypothetical protein [Deltaproteobacteria bacterium]